MKKTVWTVLLFLLTLSLLVSCGNKREQVPDPTEMAPKDFTLNRLTLSLTEGFSEDTAEGVRILRASTVAVFVDRVDFANLAGAADLPLLTYAKDFSDMATESDGLVLLEYTANGSEGLTYSYFTAFYKSAGAFYTLQFACRSELYSVYRESFVKWARSAVPTV